MVTMTPDRVRLMRKIGLFTGFGLVVFVVALYASFPYDRAREAAVRMASKNLDLDVEIGSAGPAFGLAIMFHDIRVRTRPMTGKPTRFTIDSAKFSPSILAPLMSSIPFTLTLEGLGGKAVLDQKGTPGGGTGGSGSGSGSGIGKKGGPFRTELVAHDIDLAEIPGVKEAINMPIAGKLKVELEIASESGRYADASGHLTIACNDVVAGDGKTPLKVAGNPFLAGGLTLPRVRIGDLGGTVAIDKGTAKLKGVESKSPDGEIALEGEIILRDPLQMSTVNLYLRFKLSDAFLQKASSLQMILQAAAAQGKRPDGFYGLRIGGRLGQLTPPVLSPTSPITSSVVPPRPGARTGVVIPPSAPYPGPAPAPPPPPAAAPPPPAPEAPPPPPPPAPEPAPAPPPNPGGEGWKGAPATPPAPPAEAAPAPAPEPAPAAPPPPPPAEEQPAAQ
jgi:type II secretion system protein N